MYIYIYTSFIIYIYIYTFFHISFIDPFPCVSLTFRTRGFMWMQWHHWCIWLELWPWPQGVTLLQLSGSVRSEFCLKGLLRSYRATKLLHEVFLSRKPWSFTTSFSKNDLFFPSLCSPVMLSLAFCSKAMNHSWWQVELAIKAGACLEKAKAMKAMKAMVILQCKTSSSIMVIDMKKWHSLSPLVSRYSFTLSKTLLPCLQCFEWDSGLFITCPVSQVITSKLGLREKRLGRT